MSLLSCQALSRSSGAPVAKRVMDLLDRVPPAQVADVVASLMAVNLKVCAGGGHGWASHRHTECGQSQEARN